MAVVELTDRRPRGLVAALVAVGVLLVGVVVLVVVLAGRSDSVVRQGDTVTADITALNDSGRGLCVDRDDSDDDCGVPVLLSGSLDDLQVGQTITVTELWLTDDDGTKLAWLVR